MSFGPELQRLNQLGIKSASGFDDSQMQSSPSKLSNALQRNKSKRITKTKTKLQMPTKKLDYSTDEK